MAHYVCGILNSSLVKEYVESHTIQIQVSNIFKHLSIPQFMPSNSNHMKLSNLCAKAHKSKDSASRKALMTEMDETSEVIFSSYLRV
jgi:hypothetical protein